MKRKHRTGLVAIVGRPNVGKSTLLNALVGAKISIVSRRPQTTRHRILGVFTEDDTQIAFVDTPGFQTEHGGALNRLMNKSVTGSLAEVDAVLMLIEAGKLTEQDRRVLKLLPADGPVLLGLSKTDQLKDKRQLLPFMDQVRQLRDFAEIVPFSAMRAASLRELVKAIREHLPEGDPVYDADTITDRSERFLAAEMIREKLFHALGEELPYSATVIIEKFEEEGALRRIHASIIVDKDSQKAIVIGTKGERLKSIATRARRDMEELFGGKVFLEVWVRVKHGWAHDARSLRALGYD
jgi:GTPase